MAVFSVAIESGDEQHAFGVIVPDLPGCFSAGDTYDEALANAREAVSLHWQGLLDEDPLFAPATAPLEQWQALPEYQGFTWARIEVMRPT
ncbi:type II toxin-antitoxin system HicB family antitoxin [Vogesella fluminis]|uniref:HicB-like antitoxin of toxin-antitoxin system domain-containing protein n=1 Tax=Vogesella fluminis TaxID=1069161 RepID=A0ABQ3HBS8_9NEIS|nr:type II toxin-antitoxin system HicB family antitoxin [Vogesella fluminis]GHD80986.1 hypothetical protein GCM10011419_26350 [Vogesella fluminis]